MNKQFSKDENGGVLYNRYFSNEILSIKPTGISVKYIIDFGKYNIPNIERYKDEYEIIDDINSSKKLYSTYLSNINDSNNYLSFAFITKPGKLCLGVYNKMSKAVATFIVEDSKYNVVQVIPTGLFAYYILEDESGLYYLCKLQYNTIE